MRRTLTILLWLLPLLASRAEAKHYSHPRIEQDVQLQSDGSAIVQEIRTFDFVGQFGRAYVDRLPSGDYGQYRITYEGVWDADTGEKLDWSQGINEGYTRVSWRYSANNEIKRFRLRYKIDWAVQKYRDVAQFYWKCIEDDHAAIDSVILTISLPEKPPTLFAAFVHTRAGTGDRKFSSDSSVVVLRLGYVPTSSFVETRILTDAEVFPNASSRIGEDRPSLMEAERKIMEPTMREMASRYTAELLTILYFLALVIFGFFLYIIYGREPVVDEGMYLREPPSDIPACMVPAILTQEDIDVKLLANGFSAALLECGRQGFVEFKDAGRQDSETDFVLTEKGRDLINRHAGGTSVKEDTLSQFEIEVLKTVFREAGFEGKVTTNGLKAWAKQPTGTSNEIRSFLTSWGTSMRVWFETKRFELDDPESSAISRGLPAGSFIVAFVLFFLMGVKDSSAIVAVLMGAAVVITGVKLGPVLAKRTQQGAREVHRWNAFRNFLKDFSNLENASEKMLPMWDRYLVYATALGVATEFSEQMRKAAMQLPNANWSSEADRPWVPTWYSALHSGSHGDFQMSDVTSSLSSSLRDTASNYSSMARDFRNSTSGSGWDFGGGGGGGFGGGFSGGGGGGGGGGGSGAS